MTNVGIMFNDADWKSYLKVGNKTSIYIYIIYDNCRMIQPNVVRS